MLDVVNVGKSINGVEVLNSVSLQVGIGEVIAITGPSGSGKTTLLNILLGLDCPDRGEVSLEGENYSGKSEKQRRKFRLENIGVVDQNNSLIEEVCCADNIDLIARMAGRSKHGEKASSIILKALSMQEYASRMPGTLSGGERQRINIACALANAPKMLAADEPTSSLDDDSAFLVINLLKKIAQNNQTIVIIVTHDQRVKVAVDKNYDIRDLDHGREKV